MTYTDSFDTGYIGAHRWHVDLVGGAFKWTCVCGEFGNSAGNLSFLLHSFGEHANRKLEQAAVALVLAPLPHNRATYTRLLIQAEQAKEAGDKDKGNILMLAANERFRESQEALHSIYSSLRWTSWPEYNSEGRAVEVDGPWRERYWLHIVPSEVLEGTWVWETWLVNEDGDERKLSQGGSPSQEAAQEAAWNAVVKREEDLADQAEEPF